jgi:hypothetical protein
VKRASVLLLLSAPLAPQEILWERVGVRDVVRFGSQVVSVGDLNGDGCEDLLHRVFTREPTRGIDQTELWLLSGRDGTVLRSRPSYALMRPYESIAGVGDMDGDGVADYATSIGDQTGLRRDRILEVRSTRDDSLIWSTTGTWESLLGLSLLGRIDLNGDGHPDLVASAPRANVNGRLYAFAHDGRLLYQIDGDDQVALAFQMGEYLIGKVGDLDRDGGEDFVVGAWDYALRRNAALVLSGRTGQLLVRGICPDPNAWMGWAQDGCGDMDGDGVLDFVSGASDSATGGIMVAFSGRTGNPIRTWYGPGHFWDGFGQSLSSKGLDLDLDGVPDVFTSAQTEGVPGKGVLYAYSGRDGSQLWRFGGNVQDPFGALGTYLTALPAFPDNPFPVVVGCEPVYRYVEVSPYYLGRIRAFRASPPGIRTFGTAGRGTLLRTPLLGIRAAGQTVRFHLSQAEPGSTGLLLMGTSNTSFAGTPLPMVLDPLGLVGCSLLVAPELVFAATTGNGGLASGYAALDLPLTLATGPGTVPVFVQWLALGSASTWPGGVTAGLSFRL